MELKFLKDRERRKKKRKELQQILDDDLNGLIIHYACEDFNTSDGTSPRIVAIAILNLKSHQSELFSILEEAELLSREPKVKINECYRDLEFAMLQKFFQYVKQHRQKKWLHWGMRSDKYGFQALKKRYQILVNQLNIGAGSLETLPEIDDDNLFDISRCLKMLYGENYVPKDKKRMDELVARNGINNPDFLNGKAEADCGKNGEYLKINNSVLIKVVIFEQILRRIEDGSLKTDGNIMEIWVNDIAGSLAVQVMGLFTIPITIGGGVIWFILEFNNIRHWLHL